MEFENLLYEVHERVATITLNRPERLNAFNYSMPRELRLAVEAADDDHEVHVMVLQGAGKGFCGGYDLASSAEASGEMHGLQEMPWDPTEGMWFRERAQQAGFKQAVAERDSGDPIAPGASKVMPPLNEQP